MAFGQEMISDRTLDTVRITERAQKTFTVGRSVTVLDSAQLHLATLTHLGQALEQFSAIPIRNYGNGMLSVLSVRGTGSGHTAVNWNGLSINSPMLGQQDLSLIQSISFDQASIQWGATSTLVGTDAVSGAVLLSSKPHWQSGLNAQASVQAGSFGRKGVQVAARYGNNLARLTGRTGFAWLDIQNNFPYRNTSRFGQPVERQKHAGIRQFSAVQDLYSKLGDRYYVSLNSWYTGADRQLQPGIGITGQETQKDDALRLVVSLVGSHNRRSSLIQIGHTTESIHYTNPIVRTNDHSVANQTQLRLEEQWQLRDHVAIWQVKAGVEGAAATANVPAYQVKQNQWRADGYGMATYENNRLRVSGQLRKGWVTGFDPPVVPSLGADYQLVSGDKLTLLAKVHLSRVYRVPTLNDRYWRPGGNSNLRPETGWSQEGGVLLSSKSALSTTSASDWEASATVYHALVYDWILWRPNANEGYWSAQNLQTVRSRGVETFFSVRQRTGKGHLTSRLHINYNRISQAHNTGAAHAPAAGNQLLYAPLVTINQQNRFVYKAWEAGIQTNYTSRRYTLTDNSTFLPGFMMVNAQLSREIYWGKKLLRLFFSGYNLTNVTYQTVENRAMPGLNYNITLFANFN
ncbi:TonB-dependent receptor plug domain-containing protein [Nibrella saemangeumensis]|uniref:TonB-dependent receptor plug domain-containing protein n=1 Tax=Nibrella saemangeumensis TaxID=1084526 RepID=A0ABP8MHI3_9BACT